MALKKDGLARFRQGLPGAIDRGVAATAERIAALERKLAPYDPTANHTHLNESIEVQGDVGSMKRRVVAGVDLPDARAIYNEYGTEKMAAQPYAGPAAQQVKMAPEIAKEITDLARRSTR